MHIGRFTSDEYSYFMNGQPLPTVNVEKDLGVYVDSQLKFHHHTAAVIARANCILAIINKSFVNLDSSMFPMLWSDQSLSMLMPSGGPFYITDHDQHDIEKVQKRATRIVASIRHLPYIHRLKILKLPSLQYRHMQGDMILV